MNTDIQQHIEKVRGEIMLSHSERIRMRNVLRAHMESNPVALPTSGTIASYLFSMVRPLALSMLAFIAMSTVAVSYAAQSALPQDFLYPVKTRINEPIAGVLAVSSAAKTAWAMQVAGERIKEASTLVAEGRLSSSTQDELQTSFVAHSQEAQQNIVAQALSDPEASAEARVRFQAQLSEYGTVLEQIAVARHTDVTTLADAVTRESDQVLSLRPAAMPGTDSTQAVTHAAAGMQDAARRQLERSVRLAHAAGDSISASSAVIVSTQLSDASSTIAVGNDLSRNHASSDAIGVFQHALAATEKLGVFLQTSADIHARTGLVVDEPRRHATSTTQTFSSHRGAYLKATEVMTHASSSTAIDASSTTDGSIEQHIAPLLPVSVGATSTHTDEGGEARGEERSSTILQVSVPLTIVP
jgi:hypothetical protein